MARASLRLPQNAPGEFFVDETCIDCATCRHVAPGVFAYSPAAGMTVVRRQPDGPGETHRAAMALVACPTASIGSASKVDARAASRAFPEPVTEDVYYCGFASEDSFGARSWLIVRPGGNVLVDSPRAARPLMDRIAELGGVRTMFLTHRDDVADHEVFARHFGCERVLHAADVGSGTRGIERILEGTAPVALAPDLLAIPVPGHTRGSTALLFRSEVLFTGDHLWGREGSARLGASRGVCWYSWPEQIRSMERLLELGFSWVLPGHGASLHAPSQAAMREELLRLVEEMKSARQRG
jgi:glyoxylase-like metal-dependent hydrolase (beta-lactamase superfamily II)/ferredoxin